MSLFNLTFLAPAAFLGLLALAIPLYLHMRHKPRAEIYPFPALDFLLKAQKKKKRRFRVEQLLLMLFRIAIICLMAFLFAKPFVDEQLGESSFASGQPLLILLDDSASMFSGPSNARFFDEARDRIGEMLGRRGGAPTFLLLASNPDRHGALRTASELRAVLPELRATTLHHTLDGAYARALEIVEAEGFEQSTLQIFSDGAQNAWLELPTRKPENVDVIYSSMRAELPEFHNVGILDVGQSPGDRNSVEVSLRNSDQAPSEVKLSMRGPGLPTVDNQMRIDALSATSHFFSMGDQVPASVTISISDDDFDLDNQVIYAPRANKLTRVLIADGDTHPEPVNNESFFVKNALGFEESEKYGYQFEVVTPVGLTAAKIAEADVIFVLNVDLPPEKLLGDALAAGKGVFIGMGDRMDFESWNSFFKRFELEVWEHKVLRQPLQLQIKDADHPMFQPITPVEWRSYLSGVGINTFRIMSLGRAHAKVPMALSDGSPLLVSLDTQPGRLMIWTSSMDVDWTNFPLEFGFLPFVRQVTAFLGSRDTASSYQSYTVEEVVARDLQDKLALKYTPPVFESLVHDGPKPGIYTRVINNTTEFVQVRLDPRELDLAGLAEGGDDPTESEALAGLGFRSYVRKDLAPGVQWLLFLLVLVETIVAGRTSLNWGSR